MTGWLRSHLQGLSRSFRRLAATPLASLLNIGVIGLALSVPVLGYVALQNMHDLVPRLHGESEVTVFLLPGTSRADAHSVERSLRGDANVRAVRFVSREAALAGLRQSAALGEVVAVLRENPLPDAYVATLSTNDPAAAERLAVTVRQSKLVAHVQAESLWARRLEAILGVGMRAVGVLALVLGLALVGVTFNTIRLQILTDRAEIEVSKLVGATDAFVRRPFLYWGAWTGGLGGVLALGISAAACVLIEPEVARLSQLYGARLGVGFMDGGDAVAVLALSTALGWVGAALSVSKHLRDIQPS